MSSDIFWLCLWLMDWDSEYSSHRMRSVIVDSSHSFVNNDTFSDGIADPWDADLKVISWKESSSSYSSKKLREALKFMWRRSGGLP